MSRLARFLHHATISQQERVDVSDDSSNDRTDIDKTCVCFPEIWRSCYDLRSDGGDGDDAADQACVVKHYYPSAGKGQSSPRLDGLFEQASTRFDKTQRLDIGEWLMDRELLFAGGLLVLDVFVVSKLSLLLRLGTGDTFDRHVSGVQCLGDEEDDSEETGGRKGQTDPEYHLPALLKDDVAARDSTCEGADDEHDSIHRLFS